MSRPVESPFLDHELVANAEAGWESNAAAVAAESPFLGEVEERLFEAFVPKVSQGVLKRRITEYFNLAHFEYTIPAHTGPGGTLVAATKVKARPQFRYARLDEEPEKKAAINRIHRLVGSSLAPEHRKAIGKAVYGRPKPKNIAAITQALIDKGELDAVRAANPSASNSSLVRALQMKFKVGIDCAGYVQLAFIFAFTGSDDDPPSLRKRLGLHPQRSEERLRKLSDRHFTRLPLADSQTGDLIVLKEQAHSRDGAWHTVIIVNHTVAGTVHTFEVDASWGTDLYGFVHGGVRRRLWQHDTSTGKWWDISPAKRRVCGQDVEMGGKACESDIGPYDSHPLDGFFRAKEEP